MTVFHRTGMLLWAAIAAVLTGCAPSLPRPHWKTHEQALAILRTRTEHVESLSGRARVLLSRSGGQSVVLDGVLIARGDDLRLRAYKFNRAIFDMILRPQEAWLWQAPGHAQADLDLRDIDPAAAGGPALWTLLMGRVPEGASIAMDDDDLIARTPLGAPGEPPHGVMIARIDPRTLTVREYRFEHSGRVAMQTIHLGGYHLVDGVAWPMRITIRDGERLIEIQMEEVTLNAALPPRAFEPPQGASRLGGHP